MKDSNQELTDLRNEVTELRAQIDHDNETRQQLVNAADALLPALAKQQQQWEAQHARHLEALRRAPELERMREAGLLPRMAVLMTRQTFLESEFQELRKLAIETHTAVKELLRVLKGEE